MEKWNKFVPTLLIMLALVAGTSWFIIYVLSFIFVFTPTSLLAAKAVFTILPLGLIITMLIGRGHYSKLNSWIYIAVSLWIPVFMYIFLSTTIVGIGYAYFPTAPWREFTMGLFAMSGLLFIVGIITALKPKIINVEIKAPRLNAKWGGKKIVLFSDSHLGVVRHRSFMKKIVDLINPLTPDIVFIAGDLIDGPVFPYEHGLAPLGELKSTFGIFFVAGNHDEYNIEQDKYYAALEKYVTVLNDKRVVVNDTQIVGVEYAHESNSATLERLQNTEFNPNIPSIVLLHDPRNVAALAEANATLSLSGHTHGGQFFPVTIMVSLLYRKLAKGISYVKNTAHFTSVGVGTAGPLFRLGTTPEIVVIKIVE